MHKNSTEAYKKIMFSGAKATRLRAVLEIISKSDIPLTDYQILQQFKSGSDNLNLVRPRVTELHGLKPAIVEEGYPANSHENGMTVRTTKLSERVDPQMNMFR